MEVFYEDGSLKYYGGWKNGSAYGQGKYYLKNGKLLIDGEWSFGVYYPGNGDTFLFDTGFIIKYKNDNIVYIGGVKEGFEPDGTGLQFDDDNSILYSGHSKNGRYDGEGILRKNGIIKMMFTFSPKDGENHVLVYNDEGEIIFQGNEKNNLKSGVCIEYHHGIIRFIGMYKNGVRNGYGCSYNEFGEIEFVGRWKDDAKTNSACNEEFFLHSIKPTMGYSTTNYEKAVFPLSKEFLLISGLLFILALILIGIQHFQNTPRSQTVHLSNGAIWNGTVIQGNPNGNGFYYHSNHSLYYHGDCWNGYFHGNGTMYYGDGITKHFEGLWEYGYLKEGSLFDENGALQYTGQFQSKIPHGIGRSYVNNSIQFEGVWYYGCDIRGRYFANNEIYLLRNKNKECRIF